MYGRNKCDVGERKFVCERFSTGHYQISSLVDYQVVRVRERGLGLRFEPNNLLTLTHEPRQSLLCRTLHIFLLLGYEASQALRNAFFPGNLTPTIQTIDQSASHHDGLG